MQRYMYSCDACLIPVLHFYVFPGFFQPIFVISLEEQLVYHLVHEHIYEVFRIFRVGWYGQWVRERHRVTNYIALHLLLLPFESCYPRHFCKNFLFVFSPHGLDYLDIVLDLGWCGIFLPPGAVLANLVVQG